MTKTPELSLSEEAIHRYSRQLLLPEWGGRGQAQLLRSSVGILGDSEVASICARYLEAAGVGTIRFGEERMTGREALVVEAPPARSDPERMLLGSLLATQALMQLLGLRNFSVPPVPFDLS